jgi:hypothetical protein
VSYRLFWKKKKPSVIQIQRRNSEVVASVEVASRLATRQRGKQDRMQKIDEARTTRAPSYIFC